MSTQKHPKQQNNNNANPNFEQLQLPENFGAEVFELELQIEESTKVPLETVTKLLEYYAIAIQYYESIQSSRYLIFKNRTQSLLLQNNVNKAMQKDQIIKEEIKRRKQVQKQKIQNTTPDKENQEPEIEKQRQQEFLDQIEKIDKQDVVSPSKQQEYQMEMMQKKQKKKELQNTIKFFKQEDRRNQITQIIGEALIKQLKYDQLQRNIISQQYSDLYKRTEIIRRNRNNLSSQRQSRHNSEIKQTEHFSQEQQKINTQSTETDLDNVIENNKNLQAMMENVSIQNN